MFPHLDSVVCPDVPLKDKVTYFASLNLFHGANIDEKQVNGILAKISELIDSPLTRCEGLLLMEALMQQCTPLYFSNWHKVILANLQASNNLCQEITLRILKLILRPSKCPAYRLNVEHYLIPITELLTTTDNANCAAAIECLSLCIRHYPSSFHDKLSSLEQFIMKHVDTNSTQISEAIADCLSVLPQCSVVQKNGPCKAYTVTFKKVLYTLQDILNKLTNTNEVHDIDDEETSETSEIFTLPDMPETEFSEIMMLARSFSTFSVCIAKFLSQEKAVLEVPLLWILKFIERVFNLNEYVKGCNSIERRELIFLAYPVVQKGAFTILESLLQNFGLIHLTENIISLLSRAIEASYIATFTGGTNCQMRYITWSIMNVWLKKNGTQVAIEAGNNKTLLHELFKDIKPENIDDIASENVKRHQMSSKNKKAAGPKFPVPDETSYFNKNRINVCNEALKVLNELVNTAGSFLEEKFKEDIANQILAVCHTIQKFTHPHKKFPFPYMNEECRINLFKTVTALAASSDFSIKVLQRAFTVLRIAQRDESCEIKLLTRRAISITRLMLQPKKKFPEAVTNKKTAFKSAIEDNICSGWENVTAWSVNHSTQENNIADSQIEVSENNASHSPPETRNSVEENEIQNNFAPEEEYRTSNLDTSLNSSQSDSENESIMEQEIVDSENNQESNAIPYVNTINSNDIAKKVTPTEIDVSSEEANSSVGEEEELEDSRVEEEEEDEEEDEEEEEELNVNKVVVRADQNGLASTSEEEETPAVFTKSENGECSSEEGSCDEEETSKEVINDLKHEIEALEEDERPTKKQKLNDDPVETLEEDERLVKKLQLNDEPIETLEEDNGLKKIQLIEDSVVVTESTENENINETLKIEDDLNTINEEIVQNSTHLVEESRTNKSPTFDEMCADLVLCESAQLADS